MWFVDYMLCGNFHKVCLGTKPPDNGDQGGGHSSKCELLVAGIGGLL